MQGVIVPVHEPTEWTSPAHFVDKPGGKKVRLVTDYRQLNNVVRRPVHPFTSALDLMKRIRRESRWFAKLDAIHGYFQHTSPTYPKVSEAQEHFPEPPRSRLTITWTSFHLKQPSAFGR